MKRFLLISLTLFFGLAILSVSLFKTSSKTLAQSGNVASGSSESNFEDPLPILLDVVDDEATGAVRLVEAENAVDYYLPYPGILPDHPLYLLKMIRDRIQLFLTTNRLKKAERLLHYADKRIGAAEVLVEGGKPELGITTATKAEKYLEQAIAQEKEASEDGIETLAFLERLEIACLKHEEVLSAIKTKAEGQEAIIDQILTCSREGLKQIRERKNR
ncbi:MAG: hypothetical protein JW991_04915 [Candidatus Pacebacteria bacterium]|nr:hypothetical protein [Candidatus Paceibacterota bacterium]